MLSKHTKTIRRARAKKKSHLLLREYASGLTLEKIGIKHNRSIYKIKKIILAHNRKAYKPLVKKIAKQRIQHRADLRLAKKQRMKNMAKQRAKQRLQDKADLRLAKFMAYAHELGRVPNHTEIEAHAPGLIRYHTELRAVAVKAGYKYDKHKFKKKHKQEELLLYLKRLANDLGHTPTGLEINAAGRYYADYYQHHFGSLAKAQQLAGLKPNKHGGNTRTNSAMTAEKSNLLLREYASGASLEAIAVKHNLTRQWVSKIIIAHNAKAYRRLMKQRQENMAAQRLAKFMNYACELGRVPNQKEIRKYSPALEKNYHEFKKASIKAGYVFYKAKAKVKYSDEELLIYLKQLAVDLGHTPAVREINAAGKYSGHTYITHFGSIRKAQRLAGLKPNKRGSSLEINMRAGRFLTKEQCLDEVKRVTLKLKCIPSFAQLLKHGKYYAGTISGKLGGMDKIKKMKELKLLCQVS